MVLSQCTAIPSHTNTHPSIQSSGTSGEQAEVASDERADIGEDVSVPDQLPKVMSVVGIDDNIHPKSLQRVIDEVSMYIGE